MSGLLRLDLRQLAPVIARCCEIKAEVVAEDETETGRRAILNFGHTVGHAIENSAGYGKYLHGEAISIGQVAAARLSVGQLGLADASVQRLRQLLAAAGLPVAIQLRPAARQRLFEAMKLDKKVSGGEVRFVLARRIGQVEWGCKVPMKQIEQALDFKSNE
jgi:3-dehydroquinate synthetase